MLLAVRPAVQGRGHGRSLLDALHASAAAAPRSRPVCLETEVPANLTFYAHFGYRVTARYCFGGVEGATLARPTLSH